MDGKNLTERPFPEMVSAIRGDAGKSVQIKIFRDDKVLTFNLKRELIAWTLVELEKIENKTAVLTIVFLTKKLQSLLKRKFLILTEAELKI